LAIVQDNEQTRYFLKSLGFPDLRMHYAINHYDFTKKNRRTLVIGPMGSGKTEFSARIYRDSRVALQKSECVGLQTTDGVADRRRVFYIRSKIDRKRFVDYPPNALAYRNGYVELGDSIASVENSFELEKVIEGHPRIGTWIIDEAEFFDERIAYLVHQYAENRRLNFIFPMLILNFRKDLFNRTARLLLEMATDVFPLTAYCEHGDCIADSYYTYRYYTIDGEECPALYFDPLIIVGGDRVSHDPKIPNYATRCDLHHYLPGKEYTFMVLKPLGELAHGGNEKPLLEELSWIREDVTRSALYRHFEGRYLKSETPEPLMMSALRAPCIPEKALIYLFAEENILSEAQIARYARELDGDMEYLNERLLENRRFQISIGRET
jgi:thymidine kinase